MTLPYMRLSPLALAGAFGVAARVAMTLSFLPMFPMFGAHGYGMMNGVGNFAGFGLTFFICVWVLVVSAIAGAIATVIYNALFPRSSGANQGDTITKARRGQAICSMA